jgi:predicted short-subunit dehydrogenase-like oxidoreductase (DUF2520 family)
MNVTFIGSGNLAWHLAPALDNLGYVVKEVYSRDPKHAAQLTARLYQAEVRSSLDFSSSPSGLFIIATIDEAISVIAREIVLPESAILVHTSGSTALSALEFAATEKTGVFYPLQTFSKNAKVSFRDLPIFIECIEDQTAKVLMAMAHSLSTKVQKIDSNGRKALHIAAVFVSNFSNHMLTIGEQLMERQGMDFDWLKPLITETFNKALLLGPSESQTGPARRGDLQILDEHMEFLGDQKNLAKIYEIISQNIIDQHLKIRIRRQQPLLMSRRKQSARQAECS